MNKLFTLVAGYVAGSLVTSLFTKKKGSDVQRDIENAKKEGREPLSVLLANFLRIHKEVAEEVKKQTLTEENKKKIQKKKNDLEKLVKAYKKEGEAMITALKGKGKTYSTELKQKLEDLYEEHREKIGAIKDEAPEKIAQIKDVLLASYEELKGKMRK